MKSGELFFKYRSYTPLPFIIPLFLYARPDILTMLIGIIFVITGELIRLWGVSYAGSETRTRNVGASNLVTQGPYAYTRNPLYLANIVIYLGFGIMANSLNPYLTIIGVLYFFVQYHFIINWEEQKLIELFKDKYETYRSSVKRIFPSFTALEKEKQSNLKFDLKTGYRSEKRTLQANLTVAICIYIVYILINQ